ncbi:SDR family NAD(P)-dependent oxidoreductase [Streptomyces echinatus]|uniref:Short-subunit dehydrogenase n=1 Tax=Streptomyces echinatus TaxID=67293 RepID=A0A7W9Q1J7_9ACTN|nr:SDR family NAD(P)-dependent oxidoreductase [Streptomyces echinatus]MBB5931924.1 short-subunit dehydrogenase [Streptomyces echinatus]
MNDAKPLALVTGASSGIGLELARQLAERGYDLVINAEDDTRLLHAAAQIRAAGAQVDVIQADLREYDQTEHLVDTIEAIGRPLDVAVLNAGVGRGGAFVDIDLADDLEVIDLNVRSTVHLAKRVVRDMAARDEGRILVTSSIASTMPGSFQAVYNASKSFLQSFVQALQNELKDSGVTLTSLMPGPTETDFFHRADMDDTKVGQQDKDDPAQVARQGLDALLAGKEKVVAGSAKTKAQEMANKILPDKAKAEAHRKMAEPGSAEDDNTD